MNLTYIKTKIAQFASKSLFKDTSWLLFARLINVLVQATYFIILARTLGAEHYGSFIGITALASLLFPFISLGSDDILVKEVSVNPTVFPSYWGNTLLILLINSISVTMLLLLLSRIIFPDDISLITVAFLLIADLLGLGLQEASNKSMRSIGLVDKAAVLIVLNTVGKLLAVLCLIVFINDSNILANVNVESWSILYFVSSISVGLLAILATNKMVGKPRLNLSRIRSDLAQGIYFSIGMSANNINNNIDKTMLTSMATLDATGVYGSAYRFINIGDVPMIAMFNASYPKFFQQGALGWESCLNFARKLLPIILIYGVASFAAFQVFAPIVPQILGAEYQDAVSTLRWLAPLPLISALQLLIANTLTGLDHQRTRSIIQILAAVTNIALNIWLIPIYGLYGAIWATLASDIIRTICLGTALIYLYRLSKK